jgi:hypothetical protein
MLRELAPLLAEEGIDVDNIDIPDLDTLQRAFNHAVERRNLELFSPVGQTRDIALVTLRLVVEAILDGDTILAATLLDQQCQVPAAGWRQARDPRTRLACLGWTGCGALCFIDYERFGSSISEHERHSGLGDTFV